MKNNHTPHYLYKIVSPEEWQESLLDGEVVCSFIDNDFIHLATEDQLDHVAQKFWKGKSYLILKLDTGLLSGRLVYEANPGGSNRYYHLYDGKIELNAVVATHIHS